MSGERLCQTEDKMGKCRTVQRIAGHMATLSNTKAKSTHLFWRTHTQLSPL